MEKALADALRSRCQAMVVFPDAGMMRRSERFAAFAIQNRMPAVSGWAEFARRGNLMSLARTCSRSIGGSRPMSTG